MDQYHSSLVLRDYGRVELKLAALLKERGITRNRLKELTGIKYESIDRYYKAESVERVDLDFLARVCCVLRCRVEDILEYHE